MTRGMTPIEKNIRVIDAAGNQYEATYPKRAKGLVKNGRARFIDEHTLCLACPPNDYLEDKSMNNDISSTVNTAESAPPIPGTGNGPRPAEAGLTVEWIMTKMDAIIQDNAHITESLRALNLMDSDGHNSRADAIAEIARARETTNQQALRFLEKVYNGLMPISVDPAAMLKHLDIHALAENLDSQDVVDIVKALTRTN